MVISKTTRRDKEVAADLARACGGRVVESRVSFGFMQTARWCVKARYSGMRLEAHVFPPRVEAWVQNADLRAFGRLGFSVNRPCPTLAFTRPLPGVAGDLPVFTGEAEDAQALRRFLDDTENLRDLVALQLAGADEWLAVSPRQFVLRSRVEDDLTKLLRRLDVLAALRARHEQPVLPALISPPLAIKTTGAAGRSAHSLGGHQEPPVVCRNCATAVDRIATFDARAEPVAGLGLAVDDLPVLHCRRCEAGPLVVEHTPAGWRLHSQPAGEPAQEPQPALARCDLVLEASAGRGRRAPRHRLGGDAEWLQGDEVPACPRCSQPMRFFAQIDSDPALDLQFGDDGRLYAFVCVQCSTVATLAQSW